MDRHHANTVSVDEYRLKLKISIQREKTAKPVFQLLITFLQVLEIVFCAYNFVSSIINSPQEVARLIDRIEVKTGYKVYIKLRFL